MNLHVERSSRFSGKRKKKLGRYHHWALAQRLSTANHLSDVLLSSLVKSVVREGLLLVCSAVLSNERWFQGGGV